MLSSSVYAMLKLSKTTSPQKLYSFDCITLYSPNRTVGFRNILEEKVRLTQAKVKGRTPARIVPLPLQIRTRVNATP